MRIAYLDCFAGISGDMFLGALIGAGVDPKVLHEAARAMNLGASLRMETVDRSGISSAKVDVLEGFALAEPVPEVHEHHGHTHQHQPRTQHQHKTGHPHTHEETAHAHGPTHGRSLTVIRELIQSAPLAVTVKQTAIRAFELLGASEAKIHNVPVDQIHFHEVGAVDAIIDIVAASAGIHALGVEKWYASPVNVGGGMVDCAHGRFPVPAPATADLLREVPTYSATVQMELVTPTGAALLQALDCIHGPQPAMRVGKIGYGAGSRNPAGFPNVLRLSVGETERVSADDTTETVVLLETALDDLSPQILAHVTERALVLGAQDVMCTSVQMKKGRMGTLLTVLADEAHVAALQRLLLAETSTLGVRIHREQRTCLDRAHVTVPTAYGEVRMKVGSLRGEELNAQPEFEDCRRAAKEHNVPVKQVMQAATAAYLNGKVR